MRLNQRLEELLEPINVKKLWPNYKFYRPVFYSYIAALALVVLLLGQSYGWEQQTYFKCETGVCMTPDGYEVVAPYEEGTPPPTVIKHFFGYAFLGLAFCFLLNHGLNLLIKED